MKKIGCIVLTILIIVLSIPFSMESVNAAAYNTPSKAANLVLFISFSDTRADYWNEAGGFKRKCEEIYDYYNVTTSNGTLSVKDYFDLASCGKFQIENIMPQMTGDNHTIQPITLGGVTSSYNSKTGETALLREAVAKLNQNPEWSEKLGNLDYNGDNCIDNVTFIIASPATDRGTSFYSHKAEAADAGLRINGKLMNCYNLINYGTLGSVSGGAGVVSHEFIHTLGPLDTYVVCGDGTAPCGEGPVGCWDIMAVTSSFVQYPLAHTRQELGWINMEEARFSGTYTLTAPQKDSNHYAMILRTPYSDTEFFVVEYRKQGDALKTELKDKIDAKIGGSGIILYRVNTAADPKSNLVSNYIYVFRQGEEEIKATKEGARVSAHLSADSGRVSFGSGDVSVTSAARALTYTDGTNSGIVIKNVGRAGGDTITFDLEYAIDMNGKSWDFEQYQSVPTQYGAEINVAVSKGTLYESDIKIIDYNGKLYGLRCNQSAKAELLRYTNGRWQSLRVLTPNNYSYDMDFKVGADGLLYIVCGLEDTGLKVFSMNGAETVTDITGSIPLQGSVANPKIAVTSAGVVVAYRDWRNGESIRAYLKSGNTWQAFNVGGVSGNVFQICANGNDLYLTAARGNGNNVYYCNVANSRSFTRFGTAFTSNTVTSVDLVLDKYGVIYVAYYDSTKNIVLVKGWQNGAWSQLGMNIYSQMAGSVQAVLNNDKIYVAYQGADIAGVKSHKIFNPDEKPPVGSYTPTEAFVARLYSMCLEREPEADGLTYWNQTLISKGKSGAQVGYGFVFSDEYKNKHTSDDAYIEMLYQVFMNRASDAGGKAYWKSLLSQGMSREYVYQGFAHSQEYTNICNSYGIDRGTVTLNQARDKNSNLTAFVNRIYEKAMERKGEGDGLNYWCSTIQSGARTPVQVAEFFLTSQEFRNKNLSNEAYIRVLYRTFMDRECDQGGLNYWLGELNRGCSREDVLRRFAGCPEFRNIMARFGL